MPWDPDSGQTFGAYMRGDKGQSVQVGVARRERDADTIVHGQRDDGTPFRRIVDRRGHVTTEHRDGRRDVRINLG